jgi:hypothetical protein
MKRSEKRTAWPIATAVIATIATKTAGPGSRW